MSLMQYVTGILLNMGGANGMATESESISHLLVNVEPSMHLSPDCERVRVESQMRLT